MKTLRFTAILLFAAGMFFSCKNTNDDDQTTLTNGTDLILKGTKWKLAGITDPTGSLKVLEPKDCAECYTLTFETDSTV